MKERLRSELREAFNLSSTDRQIIVAIFGGGFCCLVLSAIVILMDPDLHTVRVVNTTEKKIVVKHIRKKIEVVCPAGKSTIVGEEFRPGNRAFGGEPPIFEARYPGGLRVLPKSGRFISGFPFADATFEVTF